MPEAARLAVKAVKAHAPAARHARIVLAGIGFGAVLAHEMALQLHRTTDRVQALALFEGLHAVHAPAAVLSWVAEGPQREEACQVAALLYPLIRQAAGASAPSMDAFAARLASIQGYDEQLEYVASFRPKEVRPGGQSRGAWWGGSVVLVGPVQTCKPFLRAIFASHFASHSRLEAAAQPALLAGCPAGPPCPAGHSLLLGSLAAD